MSRRQGTEDRGQRCCRGFAATVHQPARGADNNLSSVLCLQSSERGFTLIEMIMVITITGIIGGMVAVFLKFPAQQYTDVARRAEMTDIAGTALRRITRDLRLALPNSVRVTGACDGASICFLEFLPVKGSGRYRAGAGGNELDFTTADGSFEVLGPMPAATAGDQIVVYNLGITGANAYAGDNRTAYGSTAGAVINITPKLFPFASPGHRFHVIATPVTYACAPAAGGAGGTLARWQGYAIQATQPLTLPAAGAPSSVLLATSVSNCRFIYDANVVAQRSGLVTMHLGITKSGETATLYSAAHVSNQP